MRKVILSMLISLDGFIEGPNREFVSPPWSDELDKYSGNILDEAGALLYGRVCYQMTAAFWQPAATDPSSPAAGFAFAHKMNDLPKIVFSKTLENPAWQNTRVIRGNIADEVAKLKRQPGKDLVMFGGAEIASEFMKLGLIDEYRFMLNPILLGGGTPLFKGGYDRFPLRLLEARPTKTGVVLLYYRPEHKS